MPGTSLDESGHDGEPACCVHKTFFRFPRIERASSSASIHLESAKLLSLSPDAKDRCHGASQFPKAHRWICCWRSRAGHERTGGAVAADFSAATLPRRRRGTRGRWAARGRSSQAGRGALGPPRARPLAPPSLGLAPPLAPSPLGLAPPALAPSPLVVRFFASSTAGPA